ncbi:MAG: PAS domain S-box protein, partial [Bacteroidetes bacterium]|nr:PAS domain S-box protein [Bacteroidota bacterium]
MKTVSKKNQIIVLVVVAALTLVTYMALNLQMKNQDKLESMFKQNQQDIALHASKRIEAFIDDESQHLILLSNEISTGVSGNVLSDKLMAEINQSLPHLFKRHIKSVSVYNAAGTIIYSTLKTAIGLNYAKSSFFEWASKQTDNNQIYLSDFVRTDSVQSSKPPYYRILIVSPILREISNAGSKYFSKTFIGAVTYSIDINELLTDQLAFINNGSGQQKAWVMDKDGTLLFYLTHEEMLLNNIHKVDKSCTKCHDSFDYIKPILSRETGTLDYQLKDKTKKLAAFATMKIGNITWKIVANSPYEQITSFTENNLRQTIALIGIVVLVLAGGFVLVYKNYGLRVRAEEEAKLLREKEILEKRTEAALAENEKRYRTLFENAPVGIAMLDADNHILLINKGFESIFQYSLDEAKGRFIDKLIVPAELGDEANSLSLESQHGGIVMKETFRKRKDGTPVLVQVYGVPIIVNNKCIGIYGMYVDLTVRKRAEQRIADTLKLNETILQTSPVGIIAYKNNGETISANEAAAKIVGTTVDRLLKQNFRQLEPWKRSGLFDAADKVLKTGTRQSLETHFVTTFKKEIWISCLLESFKYENEGHLLLVFEDVSQRIQSEKENRMLAHAVESVSECVSITDHNDTIIFVNDSFLTTYGYKKEELIGEHVNILRPPDIATAMVKDILPETIKGGWKGEVINRKKDGTIFPVLLSTSVIKDNLGEPIALIGVATDITEVKKTQEELIAAKELAEKSAALKSEFLAQ